MANNNFVVGLYGSRSFSLVGNNSCVKGKGENGMYVLGLHAKHDASACIFKDDKLLAFVEEERFSRIKHHYGFPFMSIKYCLDTAGITSEQLDAVAIGNLSPTKSLFNNLFHYYLNGTFLKRPVKELPKSTLYTLEQSFMRHPKKHLRATNYEWFEHHYSHAASTFYCSPFKKSLVLTLDAWGDNSTALMGRGENQKIDVWGKVPAINSLGFIYSRFTEYIGYPYDKGHEAKVMGMAAYGNPKVNMEKFKDVFGFNGHFKTNQKYGFQKGSLQRIEKKFGRPKNPEPKILDSFYTDIAATLQERLEKSVITTVKSMVDYEKRWDISGNLCLAGGVALNCKMNGEILNSSVVDNIYVPPHSHDAGKAIGAALEVIKQKGGNPRINLDTAYWGPEFDDSQILETLEYYKEKLGSLDFYEQMDIEGLTASEIAKGKVVAWFQGRMEVGARALGNRSIVADPTKKSIKDKINVIKQREGWRPLCPSVKREAMEEYFGADLDAPFMTYALWVRPEKRKAIEGVVHCDGTVRPQSVTISQNKKYWKLIDAFEAETGVPMVLNTSFNVQEPIICTPTQAVETFLKSKLDALAIGNFWVTRK